MVRNGKKWQKVMIDGEKWREMVRNGEKIPVLISQLFCSCFQKQEKYNFKILLLLINNFSGWAMLL